MKPLLPSLAFAFSISALMGQSLRISKTSDLLLDIEIKGMPGNYRLITSTNLLTWSGTSYVNVSSGDWVKFRPHLPLEKARFFRVIPFQPPKIMSPPTANGQVPAGTVFSWSIEPQGEAPFHIQWYKDRHALTGATNTIFRVVAGQFTMGQYTVSVTDKNGVSAVSEPAHIQLLQDQFHGISPDP